MSLTTNDLKKISNLMGNLKQEIDESFDQKLDKKLSPIQKDIQKIKKDTSTLISFFDKQDLKIDKRVTRIENHLYLPSIVD